MSVCPRCQTSAAPGAAYCGACGTALSTGWGPPPVRPGPVTMSPADSRNWALGAHLSALAGVFFAGVASFVGPLVIWLLRREDDAFSAQHALEALNFNLMTLGVVILGGILSVATLGIGLIVVIPLLLVLGVLWLVFTIQAALAASRGEPYRYPLSIRLIS